MGCDIHTIVQIKRNRKWEYVPELPKVFDERNYHIFSILANVRNYWNTKGFEPKGLPLDLGGMKFGWESRKNKYKNNYENRTTRIIRLPNGETKSSIDDCFKVYVSKEEYDKFNGSKGCISGGYYIYDFESQGGRWEDVPYKEIYVTFQDYLDYFYKDEYDKDLDDYGSWAVDFSCSDYHSFSYLSLKELEDYDETDEKFIKVKVIKEFFNKFFELGGKLPQGMEIEDFNPEDIISAIRNAIQSEVIVKWKADNVGSMETPLIEGIKELKDIGKKYEVEKSENIRIVFAFDN